MGVQKLFEEFVKLCKPIFEVNRSIDATSPALLEAGNVPPRKITPQTHHDQVPQGLSGPPEIGSFTSLVQDALSIPEAGDHVVSGITFPDLSTLEENELLAELYSTHPSIGWIDGNWSIS